MRPQNLTREDLELAYQEQTTVPFTITGITKKGLYAMVFNFRAFVPFDYMAFQYRNFKIWKALFPFLKKQMFFARIMGLRDDGDYCILDANIPQFKKMKLEPNEVYEGVVIEKFGGTIFLEFGAYFGWRFGSIRGRIPKSQMDSFAEFRSVQRGDLVKGRFIPTLPINQFYLFFGAIDHSAWEDGSITKMLDQVCLGRVVGKEKKAIVNSKYIGRISAEKKLYDPRFHILIKRMIKELDEGDEIDCKVVGIDEKNRELRLQWLIDSSELDAKLGFKRNTIGTLLPDDFVFPEYSD